MVLVAAFNTVLRIRRSHAIVDADPPPGATAPGAVRN